MRIKVQNVGPIKNGYLADDGYLEINDLTILIGNQGTGKSTVTKLISTCCWLEKALFRGYVKESELKKENFFKNYCKWHQIENYLTPQTCIHFEGYLYEFIYKNGSFTTKNQQNNHYLTPQIMYVPAERNFLSIVDRPQLLKYLPTPLYTLLEEFYRAELIYKNGIPLPLNNARFEYDSLNNLAKIKGEGYSIRLSEASSGIQSLLPLFIVSQNLSEAISRGENLSISERSLDETKTLETKADQIRLNNNLSEAEKMFLISSLFQNKCFFNIIEEVEQNLFPISQKNVLYKLIEFLNETPGNLLFLNTHSPYIIDYLSLAIKAKKVLNQNNQDAVSEIVPIKSCIEANRVVIYEVKEDGTIKMLPNYNGIPSDNNFLNNLLAETNDLYDQLQDLK